MDSCRALGLFSNPFHNTIHLSGTLDRCGGLSLLWNAYGTWPDGVDAQEIWMAVNGGAPTLVQSVPPTQLTDEILPTDGDDICVTIRAYRSDGVFSESNPLCLTVDKVQPSAFVNLRNATLLTNDSAEISWYVDPLADIEQFRVQSSPNGSGFLGLVTDPSRRRAGLSELDRRRRHSGTFLPGRQRRQLRCPAVQRSGRTIRLFGESNFDLSNTLTWNEPGIVGSTITGWELYRMDAGTWTLLTALPPGTLDYTDDVSGQLGGDGTFCYRVEASFDLDLPALGVFESLVSVSNEACADQSGKVFVPNAIVPGGANPVFKPVILFGQEGSYHLQIFNRSGAVIFESVDIDQGWDGTFRGQPVPGGGYAFLLRFVAADGREIIEKGNVVVVR